MICKTVEGIALAPVAPLALKAQFMREIASCLACGGTQTELLHSSTYTGGVDGAHKFFLAQRETSAHGEIRRCKACNFVFTSPQFEELEYDQIYSRIGVVDPNQAVNSGAGIEATQRRYQRLAGLVQRHSTLDEPFLDFGCGDGSFLKVLASRSGRGFEIGPPGRRTGPAGCDIVSGRLQDVAGTDSLPWNSQAFITAIDVLEHLPEIGRDVDLIRRILKPGGYFYVTVPDIRSAAARLMGEKWNMLLLEHLWYFDASALGRFMKRAGFSAVAHQGLPYDASVAHLTRRLGQTFGLEGLRLPQAISQAVVPVPAGILFGAYRREV